MTTRELDAWIREGGKDLSENAQAYTPAKYRLVAHMVRSAVRERLRRLRHADYMERNTLGKPSEQSEEVQGGVNPPSEGKIDLSHL
jgi:hypothetical protein